jgi:hypothetical protein
MNSEALYWLGLVGGFGGVSAYFLALAIRPRWIRVLNGSALLMTGLASMQTAIVIRPLALGAYWFSANVAIVAMVFATAIQAASVLRSRNAWDGVDRRGARPPAPAPAEAS